MSTIAIAGTKTSNISYGSATAEGKLVTSWSISDNDTGYAGTFVGGNTGSNGYSTRTYIEYTNGGDRLDWKTSSGNNYTLSLSAKGVRRFNSTHSLYDSAGAEVKYTTQTDW